MLRPLLVIFALNHWALSKRAESTRSKRVINGYVPSVNEDRPFDYEAIRYNVWIGAATTCTSPKSADVSYPTWWVVAKRPCLPDVDDQRCGGALIHPRIVQTAGHCVGSEVLTVEKPNQPWAPGQAWSVWEDLMQVFVGYTDVEDFRVAAYARFYLLHPRFARLRFNTGFRWASYDYGWIILNSEPLKQKHWPDSVAPVPTIQALGLYTNELLKNQEVCLFAGFGAWQYKDKEILNGTSSRYLRYGWQVTTSYTQCWWYLYVLAGVYRKKWKYSNFASWFCHVPFGDHLLDHPSIGDSGSPVHCNGRMLALVSGGKWQRLHKKGSKRTHITRTMGLAFSTFENTANYRQFFVWTLRWYAKVRQLARELRIPAIGNRRRQIDPLSTQTEYEYSTKSHGGLRTIHVSPTFSATPIILKILNIFSVS